ncbi:MAG: 16S rRNA (guanine(966)-N(2))-methyltransferase RsmD [Spirochaetia bacterium]|jgi:16S rRNA (guanine966-N2)-methyltransferase|nr:16S rRNA (guanine(966)-N(2))-methyltransferase RsmD [Spirochaetia bacterium]
MRVIGGIYGGRTVKCPPGGIRPSMDSRRESLFSILGNLEGQSFLDLFAGSGVVGIEAASRGAEPVLLIENDRGKKRVILENLKIVKTDISLWIMDVRRYIDTSKPKWDIIYADPPFPFTGRKEIIMQIDKNNILDEKGIIIMHHPSSDKWDSTVGNLECFDIRKYGGSILSFFRRKE